MKCMLKYSILMTAIVSGCRSAAPTTSMSLAPERVASPAIAGVVPSYTAADAVVVAGPPTPASVRAPVADVAPLVGFGNMSGRPSKSDAYEWARDLAVSDLALQIATVANVSTTVGRNSGAKLAEQRNTAEKLIADFCGGFRVSKREFGQDAGGLWDATVEVTPVGREDVQQVEPSLAKWCVAKRGAR